MIRTSHPPGHFYSPVVDPAAAQVDAPRIWPDTPTAPAGIDFNDASHEHVLGKLFPAYFGDFDYPEHGLDDAELTSYYVQNSQFSWLDARALFVLLREWQPRRIIEVGSGFSTVLMADINERFLSSSASIAAIEPFPRTFLSRLAGVSLLQQRVQDVPLERFAELYPGDILFIDSSHVAKTGSDVNFLYLDVLPRLRTGVRVHVHDIFLPTDYPKNWVIGENRSWNEQYMLQALLMFSSKFKVLFSSSHAFAHHREQLTSALDFADKRCFGGGSLWFEVAA